MENVYLRAFLRTSSGAITCLLPSCQPIAVDEAQRDDAGDAVGPNPGLRSALHFGARLDLEPERCRDG